MSTFILSAICALSIGASANMPSPADTIRKYIIDNQPVEHFDGTQLAGKTIDTYTVTSEKDGRKVIETHKISTRTFKMPEVNTDDFRSMMEAGADELKKFFESRGNDIKNLMSSEEFQDLMKQFDSDDFKDALDKLKNLGGQFRFPGQEKDK